MWSWGILFLLVMVAASSALLTSIILVWAAMEIMLMFTVPLISCWGSANSLEGVLKYFIIQIVSGLMLLSLLVSSSHSVWLIAGIMAMKLGLAPFLLWVPHVYSGMSYFSIGVLSTIMKFPSLVVLVVISDCYLLMLLAGLSIVIGSVSGVLCPSIKKLLAYSSVAQSGWLTVVALQSSEWFIYFTLYSALVAAALSWLRTCSVKSSFQLITQPKSVMLVTMTLFVSLAGFPPTLGFSLKVLALTSIMSSHTLMALLVSLSLTASVYYYFSLFIHAWLVNCKSTPKNYFSLWILTAVTLTWLGLFLF